MPRTLDQLRGLTVIANAAVAAFPCVSLAEQLTRVLPSLKRPPDLGKQDAQDGFVGCSRA